VRSEKGPVHRPTLVRRGQETAGHQKPLVFVEFRNGFQLFRERLDFFFRTFFSHAEILRDRPRASRVKRRALEDGGLSSPFKDRRRTKKPGARPGFSEWERIPGRQCLPLRASSSPPPKGEPQRRPARDQGIDGRFRNHGHDAVLKGCIIL